MSAGAPRAQVHAQAADDVADVPLALAQVRVVGLVEERGDFVERALERGGGVQALAADDRLRPRDQHRVVEHQELRVEEVRVLGAGGLRDAGLDLFELGAGPRPRLVQARDLAVHAAGRDAEPEVAGAAPKHERLADADAGRHAEAGQAHG